LSVHQKIDSHRNWSRLIALKCFTDSHQKN
jgi:hypothetical protein